MNWQGFCRSVPRLLARIVALPTKKFNVYDVVLRFGIRSSTVSHVVLAYCVVPENLHTAPLPPPVQSKEGIGNSYGRRRGCPRQKNLKKCMKINWNFQRGGSVLENIPSMGNIF